MGALYGVLGLFFGIALAEIAHWRMGNAGTRRRHPLAGRRRASTARSSANGNSSGRFTAQDYYDR